MYQKLIKVNIKKAKNQWVKDLNRQFSKEDVHMANRHVESAPQH